MANAVAELEPTHLWKRFYEITQVPRPSKKEEKIRKHMISLLKSLNTEFKEDASGNIVASVPATPGYENAQTVVLQGHLDMVCEKNNDKQHDFENDPLEVSVKDGWVVANGTTLGADNGIGLAAGLAVITDKNVIHGPVEILMTVDEETGLNGAANLEKGFIKGKILLNMDSEEDGTFYIGCAGGIDTLASFRIDKEKAKPDHSQYELHVTGLKGGHSGLDIIIGRGNAIKILGRALKSLENIDFRISSMDGGSLRNAIPREAGAGLTMNESAFTKAEKIINDFQTTVQNELTNVDSSVKLTLKKSGNKVDEVYTKDFAERLVNVLMALPHGVIAMSQSIPGLVETSTNLATLKPDNSRLIIGTSQRSSINSSKDFISNSVAAVFKLANGDVDVGDGYPGWNPNVNSEILKVSKKVFNDLYGKDPEIKAIHAGLECGILEGKNPGMDIVSFGPTIENAHSPDERVNIETVAKFYDLMKGILKEIATN